MKTVEAFVNEGKVRRGSRDPAEARSLFSQSEQRLADVKMIRLTELNAPFRFEDVYEALRESVQAFMALEGLKPYSHEAVIAFAGERRLLTEPEVARLDRYREIRNDIAYRGEKTTVQETCDALTFAEDVIKRLRQAFDLRLK